MLEKKIKELAYSEGFSAASVISTDVLHFRPEFRQFCEANACGNFGKNYACPPFCGTVEEMKKRVQAYRHAIVLQSSSIVSDPFDDAQTKPQKKRHTKMTLQMIQKSGSFGLPEKGLFIMAGPCNFCETCELQNHLPCRHETLRFSCLSAYCIDVTELAKACGMKISWKGNSISFFSLYCYN